MSYSYFYDPGKMRLTRHHATEGRCEEMVGGEWVRRRGRKCRTKWDCSVADAEQRCREHLVPAEIDQPRIGWAPKPSVVWERSIRHPTIRWFFPFLPGGGTRRIDVAKTKLYREKQLETLRSAPGKGSPVLIREQAEHALQSAGSRVAAMEERATMIIGASGLTTTLVLANAGLFGEGGAEGTSRTLVFVLLGLASLLAVLAGIRALMVTTINWDRAYPDSAERLEERLMLSDTDMELSRAAALLVAARRAVDIGSWKSHLLAQARTMFVLAVILVSAATVIFAFDAAGGLEQGRAAEPAAGSSQSTE